MTTTGTASDRGLTTGEARSRLAADGPNLLPTSGQTRVLRELAGQLTHMLAVLLWVAAALALMAGMPELAVAIVAIVLLNATFAFWQEYRADRSVQRLRGLLPAQVRVVRDGEMRSVSVAELARGDLVVLGAGDRIGADFVLEVAHDVRVDESMVTGESEPVAHVPGDRLMTGSFVVQGEGEATVSATGARTVLADISALAQSAKRPPSPLSAQLSRVVRVIAVIATATGLSLGVGSVALGLDITQAFLFGVGVTVALVPEGCCPR